MCRKIPPNSTVLKLTQKWWLDHSSKNLVLIFFLISNLKCGFFITTSNTLKKSKMGNFPSNVKYGEKKFQMPLSQTIWLDIWIDVLYNGKMNELIHTYRNTKWINCYLKKRLKMAMIAENSFVGVATSLNIKISCLKVELF